MPTPHISAEKGDFAPSILLPGDPLRAKHIADTFLEDVKQVNAVRNMLGYTGSYDGVPVSVMGTGMGIPSASIYATELITEYGVERLIRVGSCGGILPSVKIRDVVLAIGDALYDPRTLLAREPQRHGRIRPDGGPLAACPSVHERLAAALDPNQQPVNLRVGAFVGFFVQGQGVQIAVRQGGSHVQVHLKCRTGFPILTL